MEKRHLKAEALSAVRKGKLDVAIAKYAQYLNLNPEDFDSWAGLGGAYRRKGNLEKAIESYEKANEINPRSSYALVNILSLYAARSAKKDIEKLKKLLPDALLLSKQIIESDEGDFWAWYDLATLQLLGRETEDAIRSFNYAAELTPKTAKENFRSVLSNLNFLKGHNPSIPGTSEVIQIISRYLE